jgi:prephenate dehydrogenase
MRVTIIGGAGGMGKWFAGFFKENGADVRLVDRDSTTGEIANELGVHFVTADVLVEEDVTTDFLADTDVLLISVPIDLTERVIELVGPKMHTGSLLMDLTSVKRKPVKMMEESTPVGVEILGTHPLFGPSTKSMQGQTIIFVPSRTGRHYKQIYEMFERNGAKIKLLSADEHDETMAVLQGLTHFVLISLGVTLKNLDFDLDQSKELMYPMVKFIFDFVGRLLHQDPHLYALIQTNFEMEKVYGAFIASTSRLSELITAGNVEAFEEEMRLAKQHFGNTERALTESDSVIEEMVNRSFKKENLTKE